MQVATTARPFVGVSTARPSLVRRGSVRVQAEPSIDDRVADRKAWIAAWKAQSSGEAPAAAAPAAAAAAAEPTPAATPTDTPAAATSTEESSGSITASDFFGTYLQLGVWIVTLSVAAYTGFLKMQDDPESVGLLLAPPGAAVLLIGSFLAYRISVNKANDSPFKNS